MKVSEMNTRRLAMHDSACACCIASCSAMPLMCVCVSAGLLKLGLVQFSQPPSAMVLLSKGQLDAQKEKGKGARAVTNSVWCGECSSHSERVLRSEPRRDG